jgi:cytochrome c-type biogenesis protein CcmH
MMMKEKIPQRILFFAFLFFALSGLFFAVRPSAIVLAQQPTPSDDEVNAIARQLFCPVCENIPLDVCDTEACRQWRDLIRQMLAEGKTEEEIKQYFAENYGVRVLSEPPTEGFNWLAYIVPPVAFLAGAYLLFRAFRTWQRLAKEPAAEGSPESRPEQAEGSSHAAPDDSYAAQFEEELKKRR